MAELEARRRDVAARVPAVVPRRKSQVREYAEALGVALLLALAIRTFVVQAFKIPSGSMLPTLEIGDHILVNKFLYGPRLEIPLTQISLGQLPGIRRPVAGDVVVFIWPKDRSKDFIKRVVATEGQTVEVRDRQVFIDGKPWDDPHATWVAQPRRTAGAGGAGDNYGPYAVPKDHVFVMGDNRDQSYDSRFWGPVPIADIKGRALVIYWSWDGPDRWVRWDRLGRLVY
jgi:signal peptidase I